MTARRKELAELIRDECRSLSLSLTVAKPGKIIEYDAETARATVQPLWLAVHAGPDGEDVITTPAPVPDAPVLWPSFGGFRLEGVLVPGDVVMLLGADRALDRILVQEVSDSSPAEPVDPASARAHDVSDVLVLPMSWPTLVGEDATAPVILRHLSGEITITIHPDGRVLFALAGDPDQAAVRGGVLADYLGAQRSWLASHGHGAQGAGPPLTPPPTLPADLLSELFKLR